MGDLNIVHGDIKFENILFLKVDASIQYYIHDFDTVFVLDHSDDVKTPDPMVSPHAASPIYLFFRHFYKNRLNTDVSLSDAFGRFLDFEAHMKSFLVQCKLSQHHTPVRMSLCATLIMH